MNKFLLLILLLGMAPAAAACDGVEILDGWVREAPPGAGMMAGYLSFRNRAGGVRVVDAVSSAQFGAVEMHETLIVDGEMRMRALSPLSLPAGATVEFTPGGKHLMLMQPVQPLRAGDTVSLSFSCGEQPPVQAALRVKRMP